MLVRLTILTGVAATVLLHNNPAHCFAVTPEFSGNNARSRNGVGTTKSKLHMNFFSSLVDMLKGDGQVYGHPCVMGEESIMSKKAHGTSNIPVQSDLRWGCDFETADVS